MTYQVSEHHNYLIIAVFQRGRTSFVWWEVVLQQLRYNKGESVYISKLNMESITNGIYQKLSVANTLQSSYKQKVCDGGFPRLQQRENKTRAQSFTRSSIHDTCRDIQRHH